MAAVLVLALVVPPAPTARVNDYAGLLTPHERSRLEARLGEQERTTGAQMVIAVFPSLEGESLEDFSIRLAQRWRIGHKGLDNGVILIVFVKDRKVRLEVGYGLEAVVTDAVAGQIIREAIAPRFREGRHAAGLEAAARAVFERVAQPGARRAPRRLPPAYLLPEWIWVVLGLAAFLLFGVMSWVMVLLAARASRWMARAGYTARGSGWSTASGSSGGGGWSGGYSGSSSSGGSGGGGGFSGGGGSFGGGGASGSW